MARNEPWKVRAAWNRFRRKDLTGLHTEGKDWWGLQTKAPRLQQKMGSLQNSAGCIPQGVSREIDEPGKKGYVDQTIKAAEDC